MKQNGGQKARSSTRLANREWARKNRDKMAANWKNWASKNPEKAKKHRDELRYRTRYGITYEEGLALLKTPCAICQQPSQVIDHDHRTGKVRKSLCHPCNRGLGQFTDSSAKLRKAAEYIEMHA